MSSSVRIAVIRVLRRSGSASARRTRARGPRPGEKTFFHHDQWTVGGPKTLDRFPNHMETRGYVQPHRSFQAISRFEIDGLKTLRSAEVQRSVDEGSTGSSASFLRLDGEPPQLASVAGAPRDRDHAGLWNCAAARGA